MFNLYNLFRGRIIREITHNLISLREANLDLIKQKAQCSLIWIQLHFKEPPTNQLIKEFLVFCCKRTFLSCVITSIKPTVSALLQQRRCAPVDRRLGNTSRETRGIAGRAPVPSREALPARSQACGSGCFPSWGCSIHTGVCSLCKSRAGWKIKQKQLLQTNADPTARVLWCLS